MKVYISGPMTGYPDFNRPAFNDCARRLEANGHTVVNPATFPVMKTPKLQMAYDLPLLLECNTIVALPGWNRSRGALAEMAVAMLYRKSVYRCYEEIGESPPDPKWKWQVAVNDLAFAIIDIVHRDDREDA